MTNVTTTTDLRAELETAVRDAERQAGRMETLDATISHMQAAMSGLRAEAESARNAHLYARIAVRQHDERLRVAEANEIADDIMANTGGDPKSRLLRAINHALRSKIDGLAAGVIKELEFRQRNGGLLREHLNNLEIAIGDTMIECRWRKLTESQRDRVWEALEIICPPRGDGRLGITYPIPLPKAPKKKGANDAK